jgi:DNA polymerase-3 subunit chi
MTCVMDKADSKMDVRFYHLQRSTVEQALPQLLEKAYGQGMRAVVVAGSEARLMSLDSHLWTYRPDSFLPHGTGADGYPADQPIWLTLTVENPNGAKVLFLLDGMETEHGKDFQMCCDLFDGGDPESLAAARGRWKKLKDAGHTLTYWQQTDRGGWEKKA